MRNIVFGDNEKLYFNIILSKHWSGNVLVLGRFMEPVDLSSLQSFLGIAKAKIRNSFNVFVCAGGHAGELMRMTMVSELLP